MMPWLAIQRHLTNCRTFVASKQRRGSASDKRKMRLLQGRAPAQQKNKCSMNCLVKLRMQVSLVQEVLSFSHFVDMLAACICAQGFRQSCGLQFMRSVGLSAWLSHHSSHASMQVSSCVLCLIAVSPLECPSCCRCVTIVSSEFLGFCSTAQAQCRSGR